MHEFDDLSKVEKYEISQEEYDKRPDSFKKFKENMIKKDPEFMKKNAGEKITATFQKEEAETITVGQRCELSIGSRRGMVKYVGQCKELAPGYWAGIILDEPTGDCDGVVKGVKYFECSLGSKYGIFVRPKELKVGDFPPVDDFDADEDEI